MPSTSRTASSKILTDDKTVKRRSPRKSTAQATTEASRKRTRKQYDSDALDEDSDGSDDTDGADDAADAKAKAKKSPAKAKRTPKAPPKNPKQSSRKRRKEVEDDYEDSEEDLKDVQEVVGLVVKAPTTGRVPAGQISQNTLDFLTHLKDPACNDREWFRLHEPVYRVAEQEWKDFVESFTDDLMEVDPEIPPLPPKDVIHRIYRDIRFSNDKTPYKKGFSASFSRGGRKGIFAAYHLAVKPGNESILAAGLWCPGRAELANIRTNLQRSSKRFRRVISAPKFVEFFGEARPDPKGGRQSIFGHDDELKVAPKGVPKDHKDIDILKCRTFAVVHKFTDSEVLDPEFRKAVAAVARVLQPFVHILNELLTVGGGTAVVSSDDEDDDDDNESNQGGSGEEAE